MATNSRPTTEFHVTYGALSTVSTARTLNPVIIAPRYKIHSYEDGYEDAYIGNYVDIQDGKDIAWPGKTKGAIIDTASSAVYVKKPIVQLNIESITGTVSEIRRNEIKLTSSLKPVGGVEGTQDSKLRNFSVAVGDKVQIDMGGDNVYATVTGIGATYVDSEVQEAYPLNDSAFNGVTVGGTYVGTGDATYLVKILKTPVSGDTKVRIQVIALSGDTGYVSSFDVGSTALPLGTCGATIAFTGSLTTCKVGDSWSVLCKAKKIGAYDVLYVNRELAAESPVNLTFCSSRYSGDYIRLSSGVAMNSAGITIDTGAMVSVGDNTCTVVEADMYAVYREQVVEDALSLVASSATGAAAWAGKADPRNPMGLLYAACSGVGEDGFFYMVSTEGVADDSYINAINYAAQFEDLYAFVTWSDSPAVYAAKQAAVAKYSSPTIAQFKKNWYAPVVEQQEPVYTDLEDGGALLASIASDGKVTMAGGANVIAGGVAPGDYMLVYTGGDDKTGDYIYEKYKVLEVLDADELIVENANATSISRVSFVRILTNIELAKKVAAMAANINDHRVNLVWCAGRVNFGGYSNIPPAVVAAILATTRGALAPHAPMTGLGVDGVTLVDTYKFTDVEYEILNTGGVWVVANDSMGVATNYHQITTRTDGTVAEEDSCVSAGDAVVREIRNTVRPLTAGTVNVSDQLVSDVETQVRATMAAIMGRTYPASYGPLIEGFTIKEIGRSESNNTALMLSMDIDTPQPLLDGRVYANII